MVARRCGHRCGVVLLYPGSLYPVWYLSVDVAIFFRILATKEIAIEKKSCWGGFDFEGFPHDVVDLFF